MTIHRPFAAAALTGAIAAVLYAFDPATTAAYPSCPLRALTGLLCPLCGSLRAAHELLHGHVTAAFALNPFTVGGGAAAAVLALTNRGRLATPRVTRIALVAAIAFGIVRNI